MKNTLVEILETTPEQKDDEGYISVLAEIVAGGHNDLLGPEVPDEIVRTFQMNRVSRVVGISENVYHSGLETHLPPLQHALFRDNERAFDYILEKGVDLMRLGVIKLPEVGWRSFTMLQFVANAKLLSDDRSALYVRKILTAYEQQELQIPISDKGALPIAFRWRKFHLARFLIDYGSPFHIDYCTSGTYLTPLGLAIWEFNSDAVVEILRYSPSIWVRRPDGDSEPDTTAFMLAARMYRPVGCDTLVRNQAYIESPDYMEEIADLLLDYFALDDKDQDLFRTVDVHGCQMTALHIAYAALVERIYLHGSFSELVNITFEQFGRVISPLDMVEAENLHDAVWNNLSTVLPSIDPSETTEEWQNLAQTSRQYVHEIMTSAVQDAFASPFELRKLLKDPNEALSKANVDELIVNLKHLSWEELITFDESVQNITRSLCGSAGKDLNITAVLRKVLCDEPGPLDVANMHAVQTIRPIRALLHSQVWQNAGQVDPLKALLAKFSDSDHIEPNAIRSLQRLIEKIAPMTGTQAILSQIFAHCPTWQPAQIRFLRGFATDAADLTAEHPIADYLAEMDEGLQEWMSLPDTKESGIAVLRAYMEQVRIDIGLAHIIIAQPPAPGTVQPKTQTRFEFLMEVAEQYETLRRWEEIGNGEHCQAKLLAFQRRYWTSVWRDIPKRCRAADAICGLHVALEMAKEEARNAVGVLLPEWEVISDRGEGHVQPVPPLLDNVFDGVDLGAQWETVMEKARNMREDVNEVVRESLYELASFGSRIQES
ncbi:hypothetical protein K458DRAFT_397370 [Lentithecium fluviatile CBS 122367]|uniref:Uncharacterized protein n=1 Tax=Lentithecium fluviatile CBS 122367 TaxID=1168545 RepID=A0A6G1IDD0_9PLEO|nr:hypothetical protein K458DRAFT_397370 [Lentithecium fluviatile CBS 122367]